MADILVVDDMKAVRMFLMTVLSPLGHQIREAASGDEALNSICESEPNIVIIDWMMNGLSGYETIERMRILYPQCQSKVVFLTGKKGRNDILKAKQVGADEYIIKPIDKEILCSKITNLLRKAA